MRVRWWRLLVVPISGLLLVAGCSGGAGREAATTAETLPLPPAMSPAPSVPAPGTLLGMIMSDASASTSVALARLDPLRLRPLPGPRLEIKGNWAVQAVTPDRSMAVLTNDDGGELAIVDLTQLRNLGTIRLPAIEPQTGWVAAATFVGRSRVLLARALGDDASATVQATLVDLATRRVLRQQRLDGQVLASAHLPGGRLALLLGPPASIGLARLALVGADAEVHVMILDRISAGFQRLDTGGSDPRARQAMPGLAVDAAGGHAFVVAAGQPVAEVDLQHLAVGYHQLERPASPLQRLASWLVPPAEAKEISGPARNALWLSDGLLAVSGSDARATASGEYSEVPSGLQLIDTRTWTARTVEPHAGNATLVGGRLLAWGVSFGPGRNQGYGLTVFGPGDRRPVHLFGSQEVTWVQASGNLAYVSLNEGSATAWAVVDLRSQRVLWHAQGDLPQLVLPGRP